HAASNAPILSSEGANFFSGTRAIPRCCPGIAIAASHRAARYRRARGAGRPGRLDRQRAGLRGRRAPAGVRHRRAPGPDRRADRPAGKDVAAGTIGHAEEGSLMAKTRSVFSQAEFDYLHGQRLLGRIATVGADGTPHVALGSAGRTTPNWTRSTSPGMGWSKP